MSTSKPSSTATLLRWVARIWGLGSICLLLAFVFGEGLNPGALKFKEAVLFLCFPFAVLIGLALAWGWPVAGGVLAIAGLLGFYSLHLVFTGHFPSGLAFILTALPGWLSVLSELLAHRTGRTDTQLDANPC